MNVWMNRLLFAISFMTRYPMRKELTLAQQEYPRIAVFFPIIGLLVGAASGALGWLCSVLNLPLLTAIGCVLGSAVITGGLHIDGLGDTFDALGSGRAKDRMLEIMKDSTMGTMGVLALFFDGTMKITLYWALLGEASTLNLLALALTVPVLGRLSLCTGTVTSVCARPGGMGSWFIDKMNTADLCRCLIISFAAISLLTGLRTALLLCVVALIVGWASAKYVSGKLGGITGDTMGMINEFGEIAALLTLTALGTSFFA